MSKRISYGLEVLYYIGGIFESHQESRGASSYFRRELKRIRRTCVDATAKRNGVDPTTVSNKFRRELHPHLTGTDAFDQAVWAWLSGQAGGLRRALLGSCVTPEDESAVRDFFAIEPWSTRTVSYSFPRGTR